MGLVVVKLSWLENCLVSAKSSLLCLKLHCIIVICLITTNSALGYEHELTISSRPKIGLALGGGGARGAAHVGVLRVLEQQGISIDYIAGTNSGAVVGGLYSAGVTINALEEMFTKRSLMKSYLTIPIKMRLMAIPVLAVPKLINPHSLDGLYRGNRFREFLNKYVPQSEQDISQLKIPFGAVALNLLDGELHTLRSGNLGRALQASSAIPVLRKPVEREDGLFVDGSVIASLPVRQVKEMGADVVIAVDLNENSSKMTEEQFYHFGSVSNRVVTVHLNHLDKEDSKQADILIHPQVADINLMSTSAVDAQNAINAGERAALAVVDQLEKLKLLGK